MRAPAQLQATIELLDLIEESRSPADRSMAYYFRSRRYIGSKDKAAISEQFYTILRQRLSFQYLLEQHDLVVNGRHLAAVLMLHRGESLTDFFTGEQYSPKPFSAPALATFERFDFALLEKAPENVMLNVPEWLEPYLKQSLGDDYKVEIQATNQRASIDIRTNSLKITRDNLQQQLAESGHTTQTTDLSEWCLRFDKRAALFAMDCFKQGHFEVQDEGSQLLARLSNVKAGQRVVDFCAGAGGKTLAMAAMMQNKGSIIACDVHSKRLQQLPIRAKRAGAFNIRTQLLKTERDKWVKQHQQSADVVLIDAPCSGTGTWRRSPDSRWNLTEESLHSLLEVQRAILQSACRLVKPGGRLVYATCSLLRNENEQQVAWFLENNADFSALEFDKDLLSAEALAKIAFKQHEVRTFVDLSDSDAFYVAQLQRH